MTTSEISVQMVNQDKTIPHAIVRAKEHFDLDLTDLDLRNIAELVRTNKSILTAKYQDRESERHLVRYLDKLLPVVINPITLSIITILPKCTRKHTVPYRKTRVSNYRKPFNDNADDYHQEAM